MGVALFAISNQMLYKFKFNSYQLNGSTTTTILVFMSQAICLALWSINKISWKWPIGILLIIIGTILIEKGK